VSPRLRAYLARRGVKSTTVLGFPKALVYVEQIIAPGDSLSVLGPARREPDLPDSAYRSAAKRLVVAATPGGEHFLLSTRTEEELVAWDLMAPASAVVAPLFFLPEGLLFLALGLGAERSLGR
jgi:hypothetical protein